MISNQTLSTTNRTFDVDGRMHVQQTNISKACVNDYLGSEIPNYAALGLDPAKMYALYRDPVELSKAAPTFERLQIMSGHIYVDAKNPEPMRTVGAIGSNVVFVDPYLQADVAVWDADAIKDIVSERIKELSCSYRYELVMEPGFADGVPYDGRMINIVGNHLALVQYGRAGSDVCVADSKFNGGIMSKIEMYMRGIFAKFAPGVAMDENLLPKSGGVVDKARFVAAIVAANPTLANDAEEVKKSVEEVDKKDDNLEKNDKSSSSSNRSPEGKFSAKDESMAEKLKEVCPDLTEVMIEKIMSMMSPASDSGDPEKDKNGANDSAAELHALYERKLSTAMAQMQANNKASAEAIRATRSVIGSLAMDGEPASAIYKAALTQMGVNCGKMTDAGDLKVVFDAASAPIGTTSQLQMRRQLGADGKPEDIGSLVPALKGS